MIRRVLRWTLISGGALGLLGLAAAAGLYVWLLPQIPSRQQIEDIHLQVPLRIYTRSGRLIATFGAKERIPVAYDHIPKRVIEAFVAAEDDNFFRNPGVDTAGLLRAAWTLLRTGRKEQGGSTITMQLARNVFLTPQKTYIRKMKEILLALRIHSVLSKQEVLDLYLNKIYLGEGAYGIGAAARAYYGKPLAELTLPEIAMLAGLPQAPSTDNPIVNPNRARERRAYVLRRMRALGDITEAQYRTALAAPVSADLHPLNPAVQAPYAAEMVRTQMYARYGASTYTEGFKVYTTLDGKRQQEATRALRKDLLAYCVRHGYRGPEAHVPLPAGDGGPGNAMSAGGTWLDGVLADYNPVGGLLPGIVTSVAQRHASVYLGDGRRITLAWSGLSWARPYVDASHTGPAPANAKAILQPGDVIRVRRGAHGQWRLTQIPHVEGALVALDPANGSVEALVGGFSFSKSQFNRAVATERQPGSSFKPFIYAAALHKGFTAATLVNNAPLVMPKGDDGSMWRPENYEQNFTGPMRLREGLVHSVNLVSIRVLRDIGIHYATDYATRFGFTRDQLPQNLSMALGSMGVSPLEMARGYAVFANGGYRVGTHLISRIVDGTGKVVYRAPRESLGAPTDAGVETESATPHGAKQTAAGPAPTRQPGVDAPPSQVAPRVITPQVDYLMDSMLRSVIRAGTGRAARALGRDDLAGKTGTTNNQRDAWFCGYSPTLVAVAWVGFDDESPLGPRETGARAALPMWMSFMQAALAGVPVHRIPRPPGLVTVRIDGHSGQLAPPADPDALFETFRAKYAPTASSDSVAHLDTQDQKQVQQLF